MTAPEMTTAPLADKGVMLEALRALFEPGDVIELRALHTKGKKRTTAGCFDADHWTQLVDHAERLNRAGAAVYVTLNPVNPQLLGRYHNRMQDYADATATDTDIVTRRWLLVDIDPKRPKATSATPAQFEAAQATARTVYQYLTDRGWPEPIVGESGNGMHLLYPLALPNDTASRDLVKAALQGLAARFDTAAVSIDTAVFNAGRITKLYGTVANKGDHTAAAPWRLSRLVAIPPRGEPVSTAQLEEAAQLSTDRDPGSDGIADLYQVGPIGGFDLQGFLSRLGIGYEQDVHEGSDRYKLHHCPFNPEHGKGEAAIFRKPSGALGFKCLHNTCANNDWHTLRELVDGPRERRTRPQADISGLMQGLHPRQHGNGATGQSGGAEDIEKLRGALAVIPLDAKSDKHSAAAVIGMAIRHTDSGIDEAVGRELCREWDTRTGGASLAVFEKSDPLYCATKPLTTASVFAMARAAGWTDEQPWGEPHPLTAKIEPEPYPLEALPDTVRAAVEEVAGFVKAPIPLVASTALSAMSLAVQSYADVSRAEKLHGPVSAYWLIIADSGERKSTCEGFFLKAIRDYEAKQAEAAKPALKDHAAALSAWTAKCAGTTEKIRQLAKDKKPTGEFEAVLRELQHDRPEPPRVPRMLYGDITPEALGYKLAKEWPSAGIISSEAGTVLGAHGMNSDSAMRNMATLNVLWDGGVIQSERRSVESWIARGSRLTMALQVQEPTLREFFRRTGQLARGTGFLARFLIAWPESTQGFRPFTEAPASWPALAAFHQRITAILEQPAPLDEEGALVPTMLTLSPAAKRAWVEYHDAVESELAAGGELYDIRDVAAKSADNAARLAALFQVFEQGIGQVSGDAFERASRIAVWHLSEARRFFGELALPPELADAARLDSWLIEFCRRARAQCVPTREAQRLGPIRDKEKLASALRCLEELDRARVAQDGRRKIIKLNPALVEVANEAV